MNIQNEIKTVSNKLHGLGFWIIIILICGFLAGVSYCESTYKGRFDDAIKLGGVIHKGVVYDVKERVSQ